jgi:hypothetical protein
VKTPYRQVLALAVLVFATLGLDSWGRNQFDSVSAEESEKLLVRLQRVQDSEFACLLLRRDNGFHLEYTDTNKVDIREGALSEATSSELQTLLSNQSLATLSQQNIHEPLIRQGRPVELALNIHRLPGPAGWQNLHFRSAESEQEFKAELAPFLTWFDFLRKEPHKSLTEEEGRNNCRLGKPTLKARPGAGSAVPLPKREATQEAAPFLLRATMNRSYSRNFGNDISFDERVERTCVIVYPTGSYHLEIVGQRIRESEQRSVFEDALSEAELSGLKLLLDEPALAASTHRRRPPEGPIHEVDFTSLSIARPSGVQSLNFGTFSVSRGYRPPEKSDTAKDTAVVQPLRNWIKKDLEKRGVPADPQGVTNNCEVKR